MLLLLLARPYGSTFVTVEVAEAGRGLAMAIVHRKNMGGDLSLNRRCGAG